MSATSAQPTGLPFVPQPAHDELLGSWLLRTAQLYGLGLATLPSRLGVQPSAADRMPHGFALSSASTNLDALSRIRSPQQGSRSQIFHSSTPAGQTAMAPPSSARCRTRHGRQARQQMGPRRVHTFFGVSAVVSPARQRRLRCPSAPPSWPPCRAARMANTPPTIPDQFRSDPGAGRSTYETATSPSNERGS